MTALNLITLDTVKTQLGISDTAQDTAITAMIPIVSADVRKILNCQFDRIFVAEYTDTETTLEALYGLPLGQVVYGDGLTADQYITGFNTTTLVYSLSSAATEDGIDINPTLNISQWPSVSKMIAYRIDTQTSSDTAQSVKSRSVAPLSVTFTDAEVNKQWNYPQKLIDDLGQPFVEVGS